MENAHPSIEPRDLSRVASICAMRREGKTLQEIGDVFRICRERVRQILIKAGCVVPLLPPTQKWPIRKFKKCMWCALKAAGYYHCWKCCQWLFITDFAPCGIRAGMCKRCCAARAALYHQTKHYKDYQNRYRHEHPEVQRAANKRWTSNHPDTARERKRQSYLRHKRMLEEAGRVNG